MILRNRDRLHLIHAIIREMNPGDSLRYEHTVNDTTSIQQTRDSASAEVQIRDIIIIDAY